MRTLLLVTLLAAAAPLAAQSPAIPADYQLGPGDIIHIEVVGEPDLSKPSIRIDADGTFDYPPYLGRVDAKGKTKRDVQEYLATKLKEGDFVLRPQVTVEVDAMRQRYVAVLGEVRSPNKIQMVPNMTLLDALTQAGMPTPTAGSRVLIQRRIVGADGKPTAATTNLEYNLSDVLNLKQEANPELKEDDRISVSKAEKFYVEGQVKNTGEQTWEPGMTVRAALAKAGGISEKGSSRRIKIIRMVNGKEKKLDADMNTLVLPNDFVQVGGRLL